MSSQCRHAAATIAPVIYEHTQRGRLTLVVATFLILVGLVSVPAIGREDPVAAWVLLAAIGVVLATVIVYNRLTITVTSRDVIAAFGWGWPKRTIPFSDITAVRRVRNHWFYGWGSRWIPGGWMYNVWGRKGVELVLTSGRKFRIGTDEPDALVAALPIELLEE